MRLGFIGAGSVGRTMARHLINAGHNVVLSNSRGPETLRELVDELGPQAKAGGKEEAVQSDLVILCVNWRHAQEALKGVAWRGQILVDATNAHVDYPPDISLEGVTRSRAALAKTGRTSSELVAEWLRALDWSSRSATFQWRGSTTLARESLRRSYSPRVMTQTRSAWLSTC
jgi:8-hydroxy-5-deazaflavin:NADPH oxidoreductase